MEKAMLFQSRKSKRLNSKRQEIQRLKGEVSPIDHTKLRLQRVGNYLKEYEKYQAIVEKYENNPFLKGKMLVSNSAKQEYDNAVTACNHYQDSIQKEGVTGRDDFKKQVNQLGKMEAKVPEFKGQIHSREIGLGLLNAIMHSIEQAGREMERNRQRQKVKGKTNQNDVLNHGKESCNDCVIMYSSNTFRRREFLVNKVIGMGVLHNKNFDIIVDTYASELKGLAWGYVRDSYLVEDIVQEVFLKCFIHLDKLEDIRPICGSLLRIHCLFLSHP